MFNEYIHYDVSCSTAKVNNSLSSEKKLPEPLAYENNLSRLDSLKVPPIFSAARNALYTRYTPSDWIRHKKSISADMVWGDNSFQVFVSIMVYRVLFNALEL